MIPTIEFCERPDHEGSPQPCHRREVGWRSVVIALQASGLTARRFAKIMVAISPPGVLTCRSGFLKVSSRIQALHSRTRPQEIDRRSNFFRLTDVKASISPWSFLLNSASSWTTNLLTNCHLHDFDSHNSIRIRRQLIVLP